MQVEKITYNPYFTQKFNYKKNATYPSIQLGQQTVQNDVSFTGVKEGWREFKNTAKNRIDGLFSGGKIEISEEEAVFLKTYEEKEQQIKDKYATKIAGIKDGFRDKFGNYSENKRNKLRAERDRELAVAYSYQDAFEKREQELTELKREFKEMAKQLNYSKEVISAMENEYQQSVKRQEIDIRRKALLAYSGFSQLAGYDYEKGTLREGFIDSVDDEKAGIVPCIKIPNAILLYGPTGCGKTTFANALMDETGCNLEKISCHGFSQNDKENKLIEQLIGYKKYDEYGNKIKIKGLLDVAQENFLNTKIRTIILIDEFDRFFGKDVTSKFIKTLKGIMEECSENNHVTLFLTTNAPLKIPYELRNSHRTGITINLDPPNKENTIAVLEHYFKDCEIEELDYNKIINELFKFAPDELYSNSQLRSICEIATDDIRSGGEKLNTDIVMQAIKVYNENSDNVDLLRITKKYLDQYENDKNEVDV